MRNGRLHEHSGIGHRSVSFEYPRSVFNFSIKLGAINHFYQPKKVADENGEINAVSVDVTIECNPKFTLEGVWITVDDEKSLTFH